MTPPRSGHDARALHQRAGLALRAFPQQRPQVVITDRATTTSLSRTCKNCLSFCSWARVARKATPVALRGFLVALSLACLGACRVAGGAQSHFRWRANPLQWLCVAFSGFVADSNSPAFEAVCPLTLRPPRRPLAGSWEIVSSVARD